MTYTKFPSRESDQRVFVSDLTKVMRMTNWKAEVDKQTGIRKMIEWVAQVD